MDLEGFNATPRPMSDLRKKIFDAHEGDPQRQALANVGLNELEHAQSVLSGLGHKIIFGFDDSATAAIQFPKMMYYDGAEGLKHIEVHSSAEEQTLRDAGWHDHPSVRPDGGEAAPAPASETGAHEDRSTPQLGEYSPSQYAGERAGATGATRAAGALGATFGATGAAFSHTGAPTNVTSVYDDHSTGPAGSDTPAKVKTPADSFPGMPSAGSMPEPEALRGSTDLADTAEFSDPDPNSPDRNVVHDSKSDITKPPAHGDGPQADVTQPESKTV